MRNKDVFAENMYIEGVTPGGITLKKLKYNHTITRHNILRT